MFLLATLLICLHQMIRELSTGHRRIERVDAAITPTAACTEIRQALLDIRAHDALLSDRVRLRVPYV